MGPGYNERAYTDMDVSLAIPPDVFAETSHLVPGEAKPARVG